MNTLPLRLLLCLQLLYISLFAQSGKEAGIFLGVSNYQGELSPSPIAASETNLAVGGVYRLLFADNFAVRTTASWTRLSGSDRNRPNFYAGDRDWKMTNSLIEMAVHAEWHPLSTARYSSSGLYQRQYSPFLSLGLGAVFSNVNMDVPSDDRYKIPEPKATNTFLVIPITAGIRLDLTEDLLITAEFGSRACFSDYLDGISINGNSKTKDWYFFAGVSFIYVLEEIVGSKAGR